MTETIEIEYEDGSKATWFVTDPQMLDRAVEMLTELLGQPDSVGP